MRSKKLYLYKNVFTLNKLTGKKVISNQWPSSGGIGNKLNKARNKFNLTTIPNNSGTREEEKTSGKNLRVMPNKTARTMFDIGPAMATFAAPYFRSRKFKGLYGTGLA